MRALELVASWPVGSAAAGVCTRARGALVGVTETWGETTRVYPWASVSKMCTAMAVLVAVEEGTLSLEEEAGPPGSTVAHLLAHASGLAYDRPVAIARPGVRRIYSNAGYEALAAALERRSGVPFASYLTEAVFAPLAMKRAHLAVGASAAADVRGSLDDLMALAQELLAPRVIAPATLEHATAVAFPGLRGVLPGFGRMSPCDWGLGFEVRDSKSPHWTGSRCSPATFGHFGRSGSFLWVDPSVGVACGSLSDRDFGPWAALAWPALSDAVLETLASGSPAAPEPAALERGESDRDQGS